MNAIQLNINHPDKPRAEAFLHTLNEKFEQLPFDWKSLEQSTRIVDAVKLTNSNKSLNITLIFVREYADSNFIAEANSINGTIRWGCNGSMMYIIESPDLDKVAEVLGTFAGKE